MRKAAFAQDIWKPLENTWNTKICELDFYLKYEENTNCYGKKAYVGIASIVCVLGRVGLFDACPRVQPSRIK